GRVIEDGHFADDFAGSALRQDDFGIACHFADLEFALDDDVHRVAHVAFVDEVLARRQGDFFAHGNEALERVIAKTGDQWSLAKEFVHTVVKYSCTIEMAVLPSPTAAATRLREPMRTSPAAKTPGMLVSRSIGSRSSFHSGGSLPDSSLSA